MSDQGRDVWREKVERALESLRGNPEERGARAGQTGSSSRSEEQNEQTQKL